MNYGKYRKVPEINLTNRKWPEKVIEKAPIWCSVDLRDGNQALEVPMTMDQKLKFFNLLVKVGFKQIEIGFPAASDTDYNFCRELIDNDLIPDDVAIQVLTQSRPEIIDKTMEAVYGAKNVIVHLYNSTSTLQREVVFGFGQEECLKLAVDGAKYIKDFIDEDDSDANYTLEYSPESYSSTEPDFAVRICDAVCDVWKPTPNKKVIINLPETVEYTLPNVYADSIVLIRSGEIPYICPFILIMTAVPELQLLNLVCSQVRTELRELYLVTEREQVMLILSPCV